MIDYKAMPKVRIIADDEYQKHGTDMFILGACMMIAVFLIAGVL